jgi:hypothetical protein
MKIIYLAALSLLKQKTYAVFFAGIMAAVLALLVAIPLFTIPGNSIAYQLAAWRVRDYVSMFLFAFITALLLLFQISIMKQKREYRTSLVAKGAASGMAGVFGALVATASCASCLAALFAIFGIGSSAVYFVLDNRTLFLAAAFVFLLASLYFSARKITNVCMTCQ